MARREKSPKSRVVPAKGLRAVLTERSQSRRAGLEQATTIERHRPSPRNDLLPKLQVDYVPIERVTPASRPVRRREVAQDKRLDASLAKFGMVEPILVDREDRIVHGHGRWEAARRAGLSQVPVICISHLKQAELKLLAIALNRLGETGTWNDETLRLEVQELIDLGEDVVLSGFEAEEIDILLQEEIGGEVGGDEEVIPALPEVSVSRPGDLWELGGHRLFHGDAQQAGVYQRLLGDAEQARMVLTDVPFNVPVLNHVTGNKGHREFAMASGEMSREEFVALNARWIAAALPYLCDGGLLATFIDWRSVELILTCGREAGLNLLNLVVWSKTNGGQGSLWRSQHEMLPVFKKGEAPHVNNVELGRWGRWRSNVWVYPGGSSLGSQAREGLALHPTVKPTAMLEDALLDVTQRGDIVIDPFVGSGSTLIAAETTGRLCRAVEIDGPYCDVTIRRWQDVTGEEAVLLATGQTFSEVARERPGELGEDGEDITGAEDM